MSSRYVPLAELEDNKELVMDVRKRVLHRKRRKKMGLIEVDLMETAYRMTPWPSPRQREWLAHQSGLSPRTVQIWFQNRRTKEKKGVNKWTTLMNSSVESNQYDLVPPFVNNSASIEHSPDILPTNMTTDIPRDLDNLVSHLKSSFLSSNLYPKSQAMPRASDGGLCLFDACQMGLLSIVEELASEENMTAEDEDGNTPLMIAASYGRLEVVKYLLEMGSSICHSNKQGMTALMLCIHQCEAATAEFLISHSSLVDLEKKDLSGQTIVIQCIKHNLVELIPSLMAKGVSINQTDGKGMSCLMHACLIRNVEVILYLIKKGANLMAFDRSGRSCLEYVKSVNHPSINSILASS